MMVYGPKRHCRYRIGILVPPFFGYLDPTASLVDGGCSWFTRSRGANISLRQGQEPSKRSWADTLMWEFPRIRGPYLDPKTSHFKDTDDCYNVTPVYNNSHVYKGKRQVDVHFNGTFSREPQRIAPGS